MYEIIDREQDDAGKWRIRVAIGGQTVTFKFASDPTDEEAQAQAARYDASQAVASGETATITPDPTNGVFQAT
jgi:hypothetical protein